MTDKPAVATTGPTALEAFSAAPAMKDALAKYGVIPTDIQCVKVHVIAKKNFEELSTLTTPIFDVETGEPIVCKGHTGPLMYLQSKRHGPEENPNFKTRFENYVAFMVYTIMHPVLGEVVITNGVPTSGPTELQIEMSKMNPGNVFQVAHIETSGGNRLFKLVQAQA